MGIKQERNSRAGKDARYNTVGKPRPTEIGRNSPLLTQQIEVQAGPEPRHWAPSPGPSLGMQRLGIGVCL